MITSVDQQEDQSSDILDSEEFDSLTMMLEWWKLEWADDFVPSTDDVVELEEDFIIEDSKESEDEEEEISQPELSGTEV